MVLQGVPRDVPGFFTCGGGHMKVVADLHEPLGTPFFNVLDGRPEPYAILQFKYLHFFLAN